MNAVAKTIGLKVNEKNLVSHLKLAFSNGTTYIAELMQNARRAGATKVIITYDEQAERLVIKDDGCGISDLQHILEVAESGWNEATKAEESPYGIGFLSALFAAKHCRVESHGGSVSFDTDHALAFGDVTVFPSMYKGTCVTLEGGIVFNVHALECYAKGFPIPVFLNGVELERPHAVDQLPFTEVPGVGQVYVVDHDKPLNTNFMAVLGSKDFALYLQGKWVGGDNVRSINIVHLDPKLYKGRLPDRDKLIGEDGERAVKAVMEYLHDFWRERMEHVQGEVGEEVFANFSYASLQKWSCTELLNTNPYLPPVLSVYSDVPFIERDWEHQLEMTKATRADIESGKTKVVSIPMGGWADEPFQAHHFAYAAEIAVFGECGYLHEDHWLNPYVIELNAEDVQVELVGLQGTHYFGGNYAGDTVVFCDKVILSHPQLGSAETKDAFRFIGEMSTVKVTGGDMEALVEAVGEDYKGDSSFIALPASETGGDVVRQLSSYTGEWDDFLEAEMEEDTEAFRLFILGHRPGNEVDVLKGAITMDLHSLSQLRGKKFTIEISDDPNALDGERVKITLLDGE